MIYDTSITHACLRKLLDHLHPQDWLVLDLKPSAQPGEFGEPGQTEYGLKNWPDGSTIVTTSIWSQRENGRVLHNVTKYDHFVDATLVETELFDYNERWYRQPECEALVRAAGFIDIHITKAYDDSMPTAHDTFVLACRKP